MAADKKPEAFSRVVIDAQLRDAGWGLTDGRSVRFEVFLPNGTKADYVLGDRHGRALAVVEAKRMAVDPLGAEKQARDYAVQLEVPFIFLANGNEIWFWDHEREAHPHQVKTIFAQPDLERRAAARQTQRDLMSLPTDDKIAGRPYQLDCIDTLCREIVAGRRKMLVEMATGTGKTRTAAALIKRLFEAGIVTRVLILVDRIPLAGQTEDAFAEYLPDLPAYVKRAGRRFQDEKRITITTLQSMVNDYAAYSSGYFDLVISDECHRSIYGKWSGVLKHFDGLQVGLTATPCVASPEVLAALDDAEDGAFVRDTLRFFELDQPTYRYGLKQAIQEGFLVPYRIYYALTVKTAATPCMENGKAAIARNLENGTGAGSTEFFVLRPTSRILSEYVFHFIRRVSFRATCKANFTGSAGQQRIPKSFLERVVIPLPPLDEQRRIVGLLDRAAEIRRRADAARGKARAIIPALFLDTFGDPATNPKEWPVQPLADLADIGSGLTKGRKPNGIPTKPSPYLRVANVQADRLDLSEIKMIDATDDDRVRCRLVPGDLLMTEGGDMDKLGRCAIWQGQIDLCLHQNHVFRVRMGQSVVPDYARAFMQSEAAKAYFLRVAKRTTGIASINKTQLGHLPVSVPPLSLQTAFAEQAQRLESLARHLDAAAAKAEAMAAGMSAEVFGSPASPGRRNAA